MAVRQIILECAFVDRIVGIIQGSLAIETTVPERSPVDTAVSESILSVTLGQPINTDRYHAMIDHIGKQIGLTSLKFQNLNDMIEAIGITAILFIVIAGLLQLFSE